MLDAQAGIEVRTLGGFSVAWGRAVPAAEWSRRRAAALFRYVVGAPGFRATADTLVERLWPQSTPSAARTNLRVKIFEIRAILGRAAPHGVDAHAAPPLLFEGGVVALDPRYGPNVDAYVFEKTGLAALERADDAAILAALELYTGPYLPEEHDDANVALRERFARVHRALGLRAAAALAANPERVEMLLAPLFAAYPYDEEIALGLATVRAALGRRIDVRDLYAQHESALAARSGLAPAARLAALAGNGHAPAARGRRACSLVGRCAEMEALTAALDAVVARGRRRIDIAGTAGAGKTRVALELETLALSRGIAVGFTRAFRDAPLDVLVDELAESLGRGNETSTSPFEADELRALEIALHDAFALAPVLLIIDDAAYAPRALLDAIVAASRHAPRGFGLALVTREGVEFELPEAFEPSERVALNLQPLDIASVRAVVASAFDHAASAALLDAIATLWPGDVALALAAATHARASGAAVAGAGGWHLRAGVEGFELIPERHRALIVRRILGLPAAAIEALKALAFAGDRATSETLALLTARPEAALCGALDDIARNGLGVRREDGIDVPIAVRSVASELLSQRRRSLYVERLAGGLARTLSS